jgi:hypothetical protein
MYPATNLTHFVDPMQDITVEVEKVLVQRTYRDEEVPIGSIVEVQTKRYFDGYTIWYTTKGGDYVQGAPVSPPMSSGMPVVGIVRDDLFVVGVLGEAPFGTITPFVRINNVMRSDRQTLGGQEFSTRACHVQQWVKAAPWAERLLPTVRDGVGAASAKLQLAEQLYRKRMALAVIINQLVMRELEDDLEDLTENHSLPSPTFGAIVSASAFLPTPTELDGDALDRSRAVAAKAGDGTVSRIAYSRTSLSFMYPGDAENREQVQAFSVNHLSRHAAKVLDAEGICISDPTITPALRGLSF